jgi:predicted regulator of Ras-like GTPase activity (Roadblock/LC7/MglB family)
MTTERRRRRSGLADEALRLLLEAVKQRSDVTSIAVVDARGLVISGTGSPRELAILGAVAAPVAAGTVNELCERLTAGTDVMSKPVRSRRGTLYLAALGARVGRMHEAARGVERILERVA